MVYSLKDLAATLATATEKPYDRERDLTTFTREVEGSNVWVQNRMAEQKGYDLFSHIEKLR